MRDGLRRDQVVTAESGRAVSSPPSAVAGGGLARRGQGQRRGREDPGVECGSRRAPTKARPRRGVDEGGCGVSQKRSGRRLAETVAPKGFQVLPRRWVVERTIAWIDQNRRMSKDYERLCASGEALVYAAMIRLMTRRLVRV